MPCTNLSEDIVHQIVKFILVSINLSALILSYALFRLMLIINYEGQIISQSFKHKRFQSSPYIYLSYLKFETTSGSLLCKLYWSCVRRSYQHSEYLKLSQKSIFITFMCRHSLRGKRFGCKDSCVLLSTLCKLRIC